MRYSLILVALVMLACGPSESPEVQVGDPGPVAVQANINRYRLFEDSIKEQMLGSEYIVRATLSSVEASTEQVGSEYRPILKHNFTVHEWMKGSGASPIVVIIRPAYRADDADYEIVDRSWYETEAEAQQEADTLLSARNTTWDSVQSVLLLNRETQEWHYDWHQMSEVTPKPDTFVFNAFQSQERPTLDFSFASLHRVWLPAESGGAGGQSGDSARFQTTAGESTSLSDLRNLKTEVDNALASTVEGFAECYQRGISYEHLYKNDPIELDPVSRSIDSGLAAGTVLQNDYVDDGAFSMWIRDGDAGLFGVKEEGKGSRDDILTLRPLPAGEYTFNGYYQSTASVVCGFKPDILPEAWTVSVSSPVGVMSEFFFDPVAIGAAVGETSPSESVESLLWETGKVKLAGAFANHVVDVIELDGTVSLSLATADVVPVDGVLSWDVTEQPWETGDKLLVRIRKGPNRPPVFPQESYILSVAEDAGAFSSVGTVLATDPDGDEPWSYITAGNEGGRFNISANNGLIIVRRGLDYETRNTYTLTVEARDGNGGRTSVQVTINVTDVAE